MSFLYTSENWLHITLFTNVPAALNINISLSEVNYLALKFIVYSAMAHKNIIHKISIALQSNGGHILHINSTMEGSSPHLMSGLDEVCKFVLSYVKMPTENSVYVIPFLETTYLQPQSYYKSQMV